MRSTAPETASPATAETYEKTGLINAPNTNIKRRQAIKPTVFSYPKKIMTCTKLAPNRKNDVKFLFSPSKPKTA